MGVAGEISARTLRSSSASRKRTRLSPEIVEGFTKAFDFCAIFAAGVLAYEIYIVGVLGGARNYFDYFVISFTTPFVFVLAFQTTYGYRFERFSNLRWQLTWTAAIWGGVILALLLAAFVLKSSDLFSRGWGFIWAPLAWSFLAAERVAIAGLIRRWSRDGSLVRRLAIVGDGEAAARLAQKLTASGEPVELMGIFADAREAGSAREAPVAISGTLSDLLALARRAPLDEIVIALPLDAIDAIRGVMQKLIVLPIDLRLSAEALSAALPIRGISYSGGVPAIKLADRPLQHWNAVLKWLEDKLLGAVLLLLMAPFMAVMALLIKLDSRGPVFFVQERFGFDNRPIRVIKFRTMFMDQADPSGARQTSKGDARVTRVGRFLRAYSLDEIPQLLNVVKGDMSLVGPRAHPLGMRIEDRFYYDAVKEYPRRHRVKPGMTGWAQVNGLRGEVDTLDKATRRVVFDLHYIDNWSLWLDLQIILLTLRVVLIRGNAY